MSIKNHLFAVKVFVLAIIFISAISNQDVFAQKQSTNEAIDELKKRGQYDSLTEAYKKAKGDETPTQDAVGQMKKLLASDGAANDFFGNSVAISSDIAVIGSPGDDSNRGAAYIFVRTGTVWTQQAKITASDGAAGDKFGTSVTINGNTVVVGSPEDDIDATADDRGSAYVFTQVSGSWNEQTKLFASDRADGDNFGYSVALNASGMLAVGAYLDDNGFNLDQGSVYVYSGAGPVWFLQTKLTASDGANADRLGFSLAIDGNTVVAGAIFDQIGASVNQGSAYVFDASAGYAQTKLTNPANEAASFFGWSVAISDDTIIVGAPTDQIASVTRGSATVFTKSGGVWILDQTISAPIEQTGENFGYSVGVSSGMILVGATQTNLTTNQGSVYLFTKSLSVWVFQQQFYAADSSIGLFFGGSIGISGVNVIVGAAGANVGTNLGQGAAYAFRVLTNNWVEEAFKVASDAAVGDALGWDVAMNGDTAVIGAVDKNAAYVFVRSGTSWIEQAKLTASDGTGLDFFGDSVDIYGDNIVIGAPRHNIGASKDRGAVYVFSKVGGIWTQQAKLIASDGQTFDDFGGSVAIFQDRIVAGAVGGDVSGTFDQGSAYVFVKSSGVWAFESKLTADDGEFFDLFGYSVDIFSNTIVVGSPNGGFSSNEAGAAYIFTRSGSVWTQQTEINASDGLANDSFGYSVSISGNTIAVGALNDDIGGNNDQGSVYVFTGGGFLWTQQAKLVASNGVTNNNFGADVAIDGDTILVGSPHSIVFEGVGQIYLFERLGSVWTQEQIITRGSALSEQFGSSVAISGDKIVVGIPLSDASVSTPRPNSAENLVPTANNQGGAYFFINNLIPTAANVTVAGRVLTSDGQGLRNAEITITDQNGNSRSTRASSFGHYRFEEVESGQTYVVSVRSKLYQFSPQIITPAETVTDLDFTPIP